MIQPIYEPDFTNRDAASFDPYDLTPMTAMNRRIVESLPGVDPAIVGQRSGMILSKSALVALIQEHRKELGLEKIAIDELPKSLQDCLSSTDKLRCQTAENILAKFGRRLGYLIASMMTSSKGLTNPSSGWEQAFLAHWRTQIHHIILGGGLVNGKMGACICQAANQIMSVCGLERVEFSVAAHPAALPLIGAARAVAPSPSSAAVVADFGGSYAKSGLACFDPDGKVKILQVLPTKVIAHITVDRKTSELANAMVETLAAVLRQVNDKIQMSPQVTASVAGYIKNNRPALFARFNMGTYSWLNQLSNDLPAYFAERITAASGRQVEFKFIQDGDAAAISKAGLPHSAVLMLGSFIGMGFSPPPDSFRPLDDHFEVVYTDQLT